MKCPDAYTISTGFLPVGHGHELFYELWGHLQGDEILFFHGGPGYGFTARDKELFDPRIHKVLFFDQRAAGDSRFIDPLDHNTTSDLIGDVAILVDHLQFDRAILFGGSWGTTLALLYAMVYPHLVKGIVLRSFFPANEEAINCISDPENAKLVPKSFLRFIGLVPPENRHDPIGFYARRLVDGNNTRKASLAQAWNSLGKALGRISQGPVRLQDEHSIRHAMITAYYAANRCFLTDDHIYRSVDRIPDVPIFIVQGKYDLLCPVRLAERFVELMPKAELRIVEAGHSASDSAMSEALVRALARASEAAKTA